MPMVSVPEVLVISSDDEDSGHGAPGDGSVFGSVDATQDWSDDDCLVLDGDPDKPAAVAADDENLGRDDSDAVLVVAEKGELACRDFPHPRYLCASFPFISTPHENHCDLCHCYVCDSPAPCKFWSFYGALEGHCHSTDGGHWKYLRKILMLEKKKVLRPQEPSDATLSKRLPLQSTVSTDQDHANSSSPGLISEISTLRPCPTVHGAAGRRQHLVPIDKISRDQKVDERPTKQQSSLSAYHREKRKAGALDAQILPLRAKDRRVGTSGSSLTGNKTKPSQQILPLPLSAKDRRGGTSGSSLSGNKTKPLQQNVYNHKRSSGVTTTIIKSSHGQRVDERLTTQLSSLSGGQYVQKEKLGSSTFNAQVMQPHAKDRRVETTSNTMKQFKHRVPNHNRPSGSTTIVKTSGGQKVDEHPTKELFSLSRPKRVQQEKYGFGAVDAKILQSHTEVRRVTRGNLANSDTEQLKHNVPKHNPRLVSTATVGKRSCGQQVDAHLTKQQSSLLAAQHVQRVKRVDNALDAQIVQSHTKVRRVGTT